MIRASRGMADRFGEESRESHRLGALGEIAFARFLGVPWKCHPGDIKGKPDVGGYEVRTIPSNSKWLYLKAKQNDRPATRVVLVALLHHETAALVLGWLTAQEIRDLGKWRDPNRRGAGAWFVDDLTLLHPVER